MEDSSSRSLSLTQALALTELSPGLELLSDLGKLSAPHPSSKLLVQMLTVFS